MGRYCLFLLVAAVLAGVAWSDSQVSGTWEFQARVDASDCGEKVRDEKVLATVEQSGDQVTLRMGSAVLRGTLKGDRLEVKGSYQDSGKVTKDLKLQVSGEEMSGGGNWTYTSTDGTYTCGGTEMLRGRRVK